MTIVYLVALVLVALVAHVVISRAQEIFVLSVRAGRARVVRGKVAPALLRDLHDVVERPPLAMGTIRAKRSFWGPQLELSSEIGEPHAQRIRNVFGVHRRG